MTKRNSTSFRAMRQAIKAIHRGDLAAAQEWTLIAERHIAIAKRIIDLRRQRHYPAPQREIPKPPPPPEPKPTRSRAKPKDPRDIPGYRNPVV